MITSFYAALAALLLGALSWKVIKVRMATQITLGDGDNPDLQLAIRTQANAAEYIPILLILLVLLELNHASAILVHLGGIALLAGRALHAKGMLDKQIKQRILGMKLTLITLVSLSIANIGYVFFT